MTLYETVEAFIANKSYVYSAEDLQFDETVEEYSETITELHKKEKGMWNIE